MEQITIRQISAATGFSIATVSLALRNHPRISGKTRDAIKTKADAMGYLPNPVMTAHWTAMRMRQPRRFQSVIAVINDWNIASAWRESLYNKSYLDAFRKRAEALGYVVEEFALAEDKPISRLEIPARLETLSKVFRARGIGAFAIFASAHSDLLWDARRHFSSQVIILIGSDYIHSQSKIPGSRHVPYHRVGASRYSNMIILLDELVALGYGRPGYWPNRWSELSAGGEGLAAFNVYVQSLPEEDRIDVRWVGWQQVADHEDLKKPFLEWLEKFQPDVVICGNLEIRSWIEETGRRIPEDIGLAHINLSPYEVNWSGISQCHDRIAQSAVDVLTAHLNRNELGPPEFTKETRIEGEWVSSETTRAQ